MLDQRTEDVEPGRRAVVAPTVSIVVVTVHEQQLEVGATKQGTGGPEEPAPFRVARQVAEVAQRDERVAALLNGALDKAAQVPSVAVQIAEGEQTTHARRAYRGR